MDVCFHGRVYLCFKLHNNWSGYLWSSAQIYLKLYFHVVDKYDENFDEYTEQLVLGFLR